MLPASSPFLSKIQESNRQGQAGFMRVASHREHVMSILESVPRTGTSLCVLGAGNLNDLDLHMLTKRFDEVHLVDIDLIAVEFGLRQQGFKVGAGIHIHAPVDLTGILVDLPKETPDAANRQQLTGALIEKLSNKQVMLDGRRFDLTLSTGVLSQLIQSVVSSAIDEEDAMAVILVLRDKHLLDLLELTEPGGSFVLVTDVVSTLSAPDLPLLAESQLASRMAKLVAARNFFTGVNPYRLHRLLAADPRFGGRTSDVSLYAPWLWSVTSDRQHLACALSARRVEAGAR